MIEIGGHRIRAFSLLLILWPSLAGGDRAPRHHRLFRDFGSSPSGYGSGGVGLAYSASMSSNFDREFAAHRSRGNGGQQPLQEIRAKALTRQGPNSPDGDHTPAEIEALSGDVVGPGHMRFGVPAYGPAGHHEAIHADAGFELRCPTSAMQDRAPGRLCATSPATARPKLPRRTRCRTGAAVDRPAHAVVPFNRARLQRRRDRRPSVRFRGSSLLCRGADGAMTGTATPAMKGSWNENRKDLLVWLRSQAIRLPNEFPSLPTRFDPPSAELRHPNRRQGLEVARRSPVDMICGSCDRRAGPQPEIHV